MDYTSWFVLSCNLISVFANRTNSNLDGFVCIEELE